MYYSALAKLTQNPDFYENFKCPKKISFGAIRLSFAFLPKYTRLLRTNCQTGQKMTPNWKSKRRQICPTPDTLILTKYPKNNKVKALKAAPEAQFETDGASEHLSLMNHKCFY